jgi:hypothetical protein
MSGTSFDLNLINLLVLGPGCSFHLQNGIEDALGSLYFRFASPFIYYMALQEKASKILWWVAGHECVRQGKVSSTMHKGRGNVRHTQHRVRGAVQFEPTGCISMHTCVISCDDMCAG